MLSRSHTLAGVYAHGYGKVVRSGPIPDRPEPPRGGVPLATLASAGPFGEAVAWTLRTVLAPRRFEPWNPFNDHRSYPSPRAVWLVDVELTVAGHRFLVDPVRSRLIPLTGPVPTTVDGPLALRLTIHSDRLPAGYGELAQALGWLEAGHVAGAIAEAAAVAGVQVFTGYPSDEPALDIILEPDGIPGSWPEERVRAHRTAGLGPCGLTPDPRPLPTRDLDRLLRAAHATPPGSPARWPGLSHHLAVRGVTGVADGWYSLVDGSAGRPGPAMEAIRESFSYPPDQIDVGGMNVGWVLAAPTARLVSTGSTGSAGSTGTYHRVLVTAGAVAQHIGSAAASARLFCRPARSVHEDRLETAARLPADHDFVYLLLIGRSRVRDFAYDLTPPEVSP